MCSDFACNYMNGTIPVEWTSLKLLNKIALLGNRLSGNIPKELGNMINLTYLDLEGNRLSGTIPPELGKLVNLNSLMLSSNQLSGDLPVELAGLENLTNFRINDNFFYGSIPDFIQNWKQLERLEMIASGLEGPIPLSISSLQRLTQLRISDIKSPNQPFPRLDNMTGLTQLVLRNCNISGEIPPYIWNFTVLKTLDLSFNKLIGQLPTVTLPNILLLIFLSGNLLNGNVPESILRKGTTIDLSYNSFTWQAPEKPACRANTDLNLNMYRSFSVERNTSRVLPCMENFICPRYAHSLYINCGGGDERVHEDVRDITYEGDADVEGGAAKFYINKANWGFSSTGDFMGDNDFLNKNYIATLNSSNLSVLYTTARLSPVSLSYYHHCLENGNYTVTLYFAEIQFTNDQTYSSLGQRIFDIYIQDNLFEKDFNIEDVANGVHKEGKRIYNVSVENHMLEIRFYWAGKGTIRFPRLGVYGPLISAISVVDPHFIPPSDGGNNRTAPIVISVIASCLIFLGLSILFWRRNLRAKSGRDLGGVELKTGSFTLRQIKAATNNFDSGNKIGEGGFGPVYKGILSDGTIIAVKQLSSKSRQGNREFVNEIGMISCVQHPNLVKLYGCCIEGDQLLVVYEYMENNSLSHALFENCQLELDWPTRHKICLGIARGLAFLHDESQLKIVHRDIKATNVLLDGDLNPKISDFGLAKLDDEEKTHISTRIAGTIGYMAPEYALWGYLTDKADVYSFGVVALEIVSGKHNMSYEPKNNHECLLELACHLQQCGNLMELVDQRLGSDFNKVEAERMIKVAFLCTNASPSLRPTMSEVVSMLDGTAIIPEAIPELESYSQDLRFKALRDHKKLTQSQSTTQENDGRALILEQPWSGSFSAYTRDLYSVNTESSSSSTNAKDLYPLDLPSHQSTME